VIAPQPAIVHHLLNQLALHFYWYCAYNMPPAFCVLGYLTDTRCVQAGAEQEGVNHNVGGALINTEVVINQQ
jgi:hypothetical protein